MILEFDAGNTRIKWRCLDPRTAAVEAEGVVPDVKELIIAVGEVMTISIVIMLEAWSVISKLRGGEADDEAVATGD